MKNPDLRISAAAFAHSLSVVLPVCGGKAGTVLVTIDNKGVALSAYADGMQVRSVVSEDPKWRPGDAKWRVPAARLAAILAETGRSGDDVEFLEKKGSLSIGRGASVFNIQLAELGDDEEEGAIPLAAWHCDVPAANLAKAIRNAIGFTDQAATNYALGAICIDMHRQDVTVAATDSRQMYCHRLTTSWQRRAMTVEECSGGFRQQALCLLPGAAARAAAKVLGGDASAGIQVGTNDFTIHCGRNRLHGILAVGRFPDYTRFLGEAAPIRTTLLAGVAAQRFRLAACTATKEVVSVSVGWQSNGLSLELQSMDVGTAYVLCPVVTPAGGIERQESNEKPFATRLDVHRIGNVLAAWEPGEEVQWRQAHRDEPAQLSAGSITQVLMPLAEV